MSHWVQHLRGLMTLVAANVCPLCDRPAATDFCPACQRQVQTCALPPAVHTMKADGYALLAWGRYGEALKRAIAALKYDKQLQLACPLGHWMADTWLATPSLPKQLVVVPIPLHASKQQQRGFNQAEQLAIHFCDQTRLPLARQGLARQQETTAQFGLSATERSRNLENAFSLGSAFTQQPPRHPVLLLDDIYTTGATIRSAAQTLRRRGIRVWGAAVLAQAIMERSP